jgi:hypothetical protein
MPTYGSDVEEGFDEIGELECLELLETEEFGRIALVVQGRPEIFPVNYAVDQSGCVVFSTEIGTKYAAALNHRVAFEVDRIDRDRRSGWSVVVHGVAHHTQRHSVQDGPRALDPWPSGTHHVLRISRTSVTGRRLRPGPDPTGGRPPEEVS